MKAVQLAAPGDLRVVEVDDPKPSSGAVIRVDAAGVCAADRMMLNDSGPWPIPYPVRPGHEVVGTILEIDTGSAERWAVDRGDRIAVEVKVPCGSCPACAVEDTHLCPNGAHLGSDLPGGMAEQMSVPPAARVWAAGRVPADAAGVIEPVACAVHAVRRLDPRPRDTVMISGLGGIGAAAIAVARAQGASVISLQRRGDGVVLAKELGADHVVVADGPSAAQAVEREGLVIDGFIEATGSAEVASAAIDIVRPGGTVVMFGVYGQPARLDLNQIAEFKELDVRGGHLAPHGAFGEAIDLLADGSVPGERLITHRYSLDDAASAFAPTPPGELRVRAVLEPSARRRTAPSTASGDGVSSGRTAEVQS